MPRRVLAHRVRCSSSMMLNASRRPRRGMTFSLSACSSPTPFSHRRSMRSSNSLSMRVTVPSKWLMNRLRNVCRSTSALIRFATIVVLPDLACAASRARVPYCCSPSSSQVIGGSSMARKSSPLVGVGMSSWAAWLRLCSRRASSSTSRRCASRATSTWRCRAKYSSRFRSSSSVSVSVSPSDGSSPSPPPVDPSPSSAPPAGVVGVNARFTSACGV